MRAPSAGRALLHLVAPLGLALLSAGAAAQAQAPQADEARASAFDIPSLPLSSAIEAFATASGVQVLYDRPAGGEPRSHLVHGVMTPAAALRDLLQGTGLAARFTDAQDAVLLGAAVEPPPLRDRLPHLALQPLKVQGAPVLDLASSEDGDDARLYVGAVQAQLQQALSADRATARGDYDAALEVWIGPAGEVRAAGVLRTSGEAQRDAAILAVVRRLVMADPPPPKLVQPIRVAVHSRRRTR